MFVSRSLANPAPPETVESVDKKLKAFVRDSGVLLRASWNTFREESILRRNYYPDPSHEHGLSPIISTAGSGSGTLELDSTHVHNGDQAVKFTNQNADVTAATNLLLDPGFEYGVGNWTPGSGSTVTQDATRAHSGTKSLKVVTDPGQGGYDVINNDITVDAGKTYTFSAWVYNPSSGGASSGYAIRFAGALPATTGPNYSDLPRDTWVHHSITATATSSGAVALYLYLPNTSGVTVWFDDLGFCEGTEPVDFNGDTAATDNASYSWSGTPGNSSSIRTPLYPTVNRSINTQVTPADMGASVGDKITLSVWVYIPSSVTNFVGTVFRFGGGGVDAINSPLPTERDQWVKVSITRTVTNATGSLQPVLYTGGRSEDAIWFDDFALEAGDTTVDLNGDNPVAGDSHFRWVGTPGSSVSEEYIPSEPWAKEAFQGPIFLEGGVYTYGDADVTDQIDFTFNGDTADDQWFRYGWQDDAHTIAIAQPLNPIEGARFVRNGDLETGVLVRSGNDQTVVDGRAYAFDMEAPLGVASLWAAYPIYADGTVGDATGSVSIITAEPTGFYDTWLKSIKQPSRSRRVLMTKDNIPQFTKQARMNLQAPQGSPYPVGSTDVHQAATTVFTAYTSTAEEEDEMWALLESGTLLFQTKLEYHVKDFYCEVGDIDMAMTGAGTGSLARRWTIPLTVVDRPTPLGAPLIIPGGAYDELPSLTYDQLAVAWDSYDSLLEGASA